MNTFNRTILSAAVGAAILGLGGLAYAEETIKIAVAGPITGDVAQYGDMQMTGAKMAVEQLNAKGGVNGKKLEAVLLDDQCKPEQAVNVAGQIINQKINSRSQNLRGRRHSDDHPGGHQSDHYPTGLQDGVPHHRHRRSAGADRWPLHRHPD